MASVTKTPYIGVTNHLERRVSEHKEKKNKGFTEEYSIKYLVYYETYGSIFEAIQREKQLKNWKRRWKVELIEEDNPEWKDLSNNWPSCAG